MAKPKLEWMQFYPADWRSDTALRSVSLAARGLWIDMLTLMHEATPRGVLMMRGSVVTTELLARLIGAEIAEVDRLLIELEGAGVFSRKKNGAIYSRRMELDEARRIKNVENGRKGGNPALKPASDLPDDPETNLPLFSGSGENRGRIRGESDENRVRANYFGVMEISGSDNPPDKARVLEIREERKKEPPKVPQKRTDDGKAVDACVMAWNALALDVGLAKVQLVSDARRSKLVARLRDVGGLEGWFAMCDRIRNSKFLRGEASSWRVSFDWVLSPTNLAKIMEGNFDDREGPRSKQQQFADDIADERRRILEGARDLEDETDTHGSKPASSGVRDR